MSHRIAAASIIAIAGFIPALAQAQSQAPVPPEIRSEAVSLMQLCRGDHDRWCSGVTPGGGRILACLQAHSAQLSSACAGAMPRAEALRDRAIANGVMPK
jgi:hypothetical protein